MKPSNLTEVMRWVRSHAKGKSCERTPAQLANALAASKTPKAIRKWRKTLKANRAKRNGSVEVRTQKSIDTAATVA